MSQVRLSQEGVQVDERFVLQGEQVVLDRETHCMWQRGASAERMVWKDGFAYIDHLNQSCFAGYADWRYPSKDELASLITTEEDRHSGLYVSSLFGNQRCCWTSTEMQHHRSCYVDFYYGGMYIVEGNYANYPVRAVRTHQ
jgi:hypothetical protein